jgi:choline-glycine betaine transporter
MFWPALLAVVFFSVMLGAAAHQTAKIASRPRRLAAEAVALVAFGVPAALAWASALSSVYP